MSAWPQPGAALRTMFNADLDAVMAIESRAYALPWSRGNFIDSLAAGYPTQVLIEPGAALVGYFVAMRGVGEMHLLNITVAPEWQRRGLALQMLDALELICRDEALPLLWLEVRVSNTRARAIYGRRGYVEVGLRRGYYPAPQGQREDAVVMRAALQVLPGHDVD